MYALKIVNILDNGNRIETVSALGSHYQLEMYPNGDSGDIAALIKYEVDEVVRESIVVRGQSAYITTLENKTVRVIGAF